MSKLDSKSKDDSGSGRRARSSCSRASFRRGAEREAEEVASAVVEGRGRIRPLSLSSSPTARYATPASRGRPLPGPLRTEFEEAFDADLSTVRVHTDRAAARAAEAERARAFAAGADIYFARGAWTPQTTEGRRLIAHELTHVLQQTGRASADRALRATRREGRGPIQREPAPEGDAVVESNPVVAGADYIASLVSAHRERPDADSFTESATADLEVLTDDERTESERQAKLEELDEEVSNGTYDGANYSTRSVLFEVLKACGAYRGAAHLVEDYGLFSHVHVFEFQLYLRQHRERPGYYREVVEGHWLLSELWPTPFEQALQDYFLAKTAHIEIPAERIQAVIGRLVAQFSSFTLRSANERVWLAASERRG